MAQVTITLNERSYTVACNPGEEPRIRELAGYVNARMADFVRASGQVGEARLLVLAALVIADELAEAQEMLRQQATVPADGAAEATIALGMENLAARIEAIAAQLETSHI